MQSQTAALDIPRFQVPTARATGAFSAVTSAYRILSARSAPSQEGKDDPVSRTLRQTVLPGRNALDLSA